MSIGRSDASWTAPAERSGDGAFERTMPLLISRDARADESGVAFRLPPQSKKPKAAGRLWRLSHERLFRAAYFFPKKRFKFARPFTAMSSRFGSILRQMAAARAMTFTSVVKLSMTTSP